MILVDSSVWIDFFRGRTTPQVAALTNALAGKAEVRLGIGDLALLEVLRGVRDERAHALVRSRLAPMTVVELGGETNALRAASYSRQLRSLGWNISSVVDLLQGSYCVHNNIQLLHSDRDFDAMEEHLGLRVVRT